MTTWWWVRHGPTHEKVFTGWRDVPADLSDTALLGRLDAYLPREALLISSDLSRAVTTADALGQGRIRLPHAPGLREFDFGDWDGVGFAEVAARDPDLSRAFWEEPGAVAPPNGESWDDVSARIAPVVTSLSAEHAGGDIVAVAHIGVIMTQIAAAGGMSAIKALGHQIDNLSVTRIRLGLDIEIGPINHVP